MRTRLDPGGFRRQIVALTGLLGAFAALALVVVVQVVLAHTSASAVERVLDDRADTVADSVATSGDSLEVPDTRLDPGVAVYDADGALVAGQVPGRFTSAFAALSTSEARTLRDLGDDYRALARPFTTDGGSSGVVVVAEPLQPYENDERDALVVSGVAGLLIVALAIGMAAWVTKRALAPVAQMARTAEDWSEHDLDRRFDLGEPDDEIRALGHTLDGLLDKVARAILAEQRLTAELAHELRTPLTAALGTADLLLMREHVPSELREDVEQIAVSCRAMSEIVTSLLALARTDPATTSRRTSARSRLADGIALAAHPHGDAPGLRVDVDGSLEVAAPVELVGRTLAPLLDNALRLAGRVRVNAEHDDRWVHVLVEDDGPGVSPDLADTVFDPGVSTGGGSGLGLALARRVARSIGGEVSLVPTRGVGATFDVRLPHAR